VPAARSGTITAVTSGTAETGDAPAGRGVRAAGRARRQPLLVQGLLSAAVGGLLAAAALGGVVPLAVLVLLVQVLLVLGLLALLAVPAAGGASVVALGAVLAADALVLAGGGVDRVPGALALAFVASLLHQLSRRTGRAHVTESLAGTMLAVVAGVSATGLLALRQLDGGESAVTVALVAAGASLLVARAADRVVPRPALAAGATRGWVGLLLGLAAGAASAVVAASAAGVLDAAQAALLGLLVAATAATADLVTDLGAGELGGGRRHARRLAALRPVQLLLPYCLLAPVALLAGRLVLP
jgi:hypothetical protein